jgi:anti-sigma B factor antagonist
VASLDNLPVQWAQRVAVVRLPAETDLCNAEQVRDTLLAVLNTGVPTLIADLTATTFCGCDGLGAIVRAHQRAQAAGAQVRLATRTPIVLRLLSLTYVDRLVPVFDSVHAAWPADAGPAPQRDGRPASEARPEQGPLPTQAPQPTQAARPTQAAPGEPGRTA